MKDLQLLFERAKQELDCISVEYGNIVSITINTRAKQRWGQCKKRDGVYLININERLLHDDISDESTLNTIIHEILHTCKGCMNHGYKWQELAELVNDCYACYNIKRCTSAEEKGVNDPIQPKIYKYGIYCSHCNKVVAKRQKQGKLTNYVQLYHCGICHGKLQVINL